jgi:hypothetical protein
MDGAIDTTGRGAQLLREFTLGPPSDEDLSNPFIRAGHPILVADLRRTPKGPVPSSS